MSPLLFVLVMDMLAAMFRLAERVGVLVDLSVDGLKLASRCMLMTLWCSRGQTSPTKAELQPILDKLANKLAFWKAHLMSRDGRVAYVRAVMAASVVYQLMALDVDPWFLQAVDKLRRGFLWEGKNEAHAGNCMVAWDAVCTPKYLGGLGLPKLRWMHSALRACWIWLQHIDHSRPWAGFMFAVCADATSMFRASVAITVGSGVNMLFWEDPWINGLSMAALVPEVLKLGRPGVIQHRKVSDGLPHNAWVQDIAGELSVYAVMQFLKLWAAVGVVSPSGDAGEFVWKWTADGKFMKQSAYCAFFHGTTALPDIAGELSVDAVVQFLKLWAAVGTVSLSRDADEFVWKWTADGKFMTQSAYRAFFHGTTALPGAAQVWNSFAPFKFWFHAWLALRRRC
ncbi:hypothetical protein ACQ4PT_071122 [Festuca glaucescens]